MSKINTHILSIISSYTTNEITESQFNDLHEWLNESSENRQAFSNYLHFYKKSRRISFVDNLDKDKAWSNIILNLEKPLKYENKKSSSKVIRLKSISRFFKYAAMAILLLGLGYLISDNIFNNNTENTPPIIVNTNTIIPGTDKATLTLGDGSVVALEKGNNYQTQNANSNGEEIVYEAGKRTSAEIAYNYLTIPRGGQFHIVLADGTEVWLNSESQLKYPVAFVEDKTRKVELVYGEAYFDVSPSTAHKGSKFKVFNQNQEIEVLGTEFNIKAYKDETNIYTTLVEGKVAVSFEDKKQLLSPSEQLDFNVKTKTTIVKVVDVYNETSWKNGIFSFEAKTLSEIMKVLSRWYDMEVVFENKEIMNEEFVGILSKDQSIEKILKSLKGFGIISDYKINEKTLVMK